MSAFWKYFAEKLCWPQSFAPGPLQVIVRGLAGHLDTARADMPYLREQFFPERCAPELVADHGTSRSLVRHPRETPEQFRTRVTHAYGWHMLGGKTLGLPQILKFYGFEFARLETLREAGHPARWAEFMVELKTPQNQDYADILATLETFVWLINEYKPARSVLFRIHTDEYDQRPIVVDRGPKLGDGWLSYFSGVPVEMPDGDDVLVSFGSALRYETDPFAEAGAGAGVAHMVSMGFYAPYIDKFIVGISRLGEKFPHNHGFAIGGLYSGFLGEPEMGGRKWVGRWDDKPWIDTMPQAGFDRRLPPWRMEYRQSSYSQLVLSEGRESGKVEGQRLGDENARLGPSFAVTIDNPGRVGEMRLGVHNPERNFRRIHKFFIAFSGAEFPALNPGPDAFCGVSAATGGVTDNLHGHPDGWPGGWKGPWAKRRWWPYVAYGKIGEIGLYDELHEVLHTEAPGVTRIPENLFSVSDAEWLCRALHNALHTTASGVTRISDNIFAA